ncbi:response regulator [bacterium]|nr:response regulator [bacterium]
MSDILIIGSIGFEEDAIIPHLDPLLSVSSVDQTDYKLISEYAVETKVALLDLDTATDLTMETLDEVKGLNPALEIIGFSSHNNPKMVIRLMRSGGYRVEPKGLPVGVAVHLINRILDDMDLMTKLQGQSQRRFLNRFEITASLAVELVKSRRAQGVSVTNAELAQLLMVAETHYRGSLLEQMAEHIDFHPQVLVVEDEAPMRALIQRLTGRNRCRVHTAADGSQALEMCRTNPDMMLAVVDIGLPDIRGDKLIGEIKKLAPNITIMMLTAFSDTGLIVDCFGNGATDYMTKPFQNDDFLARINRLTDRLRILNILNSLGDIQFSARQGIDPAILEELAQIRTAAGKPMLAKEVELFYPEIKALGLESDAPVIQVPAGAPFDHAFRENLRALLARVR